MPGQFKTIALTGKYSDPRVVESLQLLAAHLAGRGIRVLADAEMEQDFGEVEVERRSGDGLAAEADLVIAVGGDGSMLHAARLAAANERPVLGINRGRLGFLADVANDEMIERVDQLLAGRYVEERRQMLEAWIPRDGLEEPRGIALNDVVLQRRETGRMLDFETWVDGVYVNTHGGDGLVISTPTGSTAYALSGGGPIVHPAMEAMVLVPICPHTLSDRPLVISSSREVEIHLLDRQDVAAEVTCDGKLLDAFNPGERLVVRRWQRSVTLLHPEDYDYFRILRSKLHWGRGSRENPGG